MNDDSNEHLPLEGACAQCRYFRPVEGQSGNCHRDPPAYAGDSSPRETHHWRHPIVSSRGWCGEFIPRPWR